MTLSNRILRCLHCTDARTAPMAAMPLPSASLVPSRCRGLVVACNSMAPVRLVPTFVPQRKFRTGLSNHHSDEPCCWFCCNAVETGLTGPRASQRVSQYELFSCVFSPGVHCTYAGPVPMSLTEIVIDTTLGGASPSRPGVRRDAGRGCSRAHVSNGCSATKWSGTRHRAPGLNLQASRGNITRGEKRMLVSVDHTPRGRQRGYDMEPISSCCIPICRIHLVGVVEPGSLTKMACMGAPAWRAQWKRRC